MPSRDQSEYIRRQKYRAIVVGGGQGNIFNRYTDQSSLVAMANTAGRAFTAPNARVPDAPLSLSGDISDSLVIIYVTDGDDGGSPLLGYAYAIDDSAGPYTDISYNSPFEIDGLTNGQDYTFYIKARNDVGYSVLPASIVLSPATVPDAPNFPAGPVVTGNQTISIPFTAPANTGGRPITGYKYSVNSGAYIVLDPSSSPLVLTGLTNGQSYAVRMKATNSRGDSVATTPVTAVPSTTPFAPIITGITPASRQLTVFFDPSGSGGLPITNYEYSTDGGGTFKALSPADATSPVVITSLSSSGTPIALTNDVSYDIKIRAVSAAGPGAASETVSATPYGQPTPPRDLTASNITATTADLTWNPPADFGSTSITSYTLFVVRTSDSQNVFGPTTVTSPHTLIGLETDVTYRASLYATNNRNIPSEFAITTFTPSNFPTLSKSILIRLEGTSYPGSETLWDDLANNYDGTLVNGVPFNSVERSFTFNGTTQYINIPNQLALQINGSNNFKTMVAWIKPSISTGAIFGKQFGSPGDYDGATLAFAGTRGLGLYMNGSSLNNGPSTLGYSSANNVYVDNTWIMVSYVICFVGGALNPSKVYVNTTEVISVNFSDGMSSPTAPITIARSLGGDSYGKFSVGAFYYYNGALTSSDITTLYNATKGRYGL